MTMILAMLLQVALCDGRATSKTRAFPIKPYVVDAETLTAVPITTRPPLQKWMIDPVYYGRFMRVTDSNPLALAGHKRKGYWPHEPEESVRPGINPDGERRGFTTTLYSSMPDWSSDGRFQIFYSGTRAHVLHNGQPPFEEIRELDITPTDLEHVYWSPRPGKEHVLYYPSSYSGERKLYQVQVSETTDVKKVLHDFKLPPTNCTATSARGLRFATMYMSWDAREIVGMSCGDTCWVYSIAEDKVLAQRSDCNTSKSSMNAPFISPSGTRAYIAAGTVPGLGELKGLALPVAPSMALPSNVDYGIKEEHRSIGRSVTGADIYTAVMFEAENPATGCRNRPQGCKPSGTLIATDMLTGAWKALISQRTGWPGPFSTVHTSMTSLFNPGWIYASQVGALDINSPNPQGMNVLYAANLDGLVCVLCHVRTLAGTRPESHFGYWGEPHPNGDPFGKYVAWNSDWHNGDTVDVYIYDNTFHITAAQAAKIAALK